jgi:membrane protease YdiL (CAAX protease family)
MKLYANFDKGAVGLLLLALLTPRLSTLQDLRRIAPATLGAIAATVVLALGTAAAMGYVRPDVKWPPFTPAFLAINLLFTCVAEEAFFRGVIQERLSRAGKHRSGLQWMAVLASAVLFGLAHAGGGLPLVTLATIAGLGYAIVYAKTRVIEASVLTHFAVNAIHFVGFSYPSLAR